MSKSKKGKWLVFIIIVSVSLITLSYILMGEFEYAYSTTNSIEYAYKAQLMCTSAKTMLWIFPILLLTKLTADFIVKKRYKLLSIVAIIAIVVWGGIDSIEIFERHTKDSIRIGEVDRLKELKLDYESGTTKTIKNASLSIIEQESDRDIGTDKKYYLKVNDGDYILPLTNGDNAKKAIKLGKNTIEVYKNSNFLVAINDMKIEELDEYYEENVDYDYILGLEGNIIYAYDLNTGKQIDWYKFGNTAIIRVLDENEVALTNTPLYTNTVYFSTNRADGVYSIVFLDLITQEPLAEPLKVKISDHKVIDIE